MRRIRRTWRTKSFRKRQRSRRRALKNPSGDDLLKIGLIGVAGYFIYEWFFASASTTTSSTTAQTTTQTSAPVTGTGTTSIPISPASGSQLAQQIAAGAELTVSQWNYYQNLQNPGANIILSATSFGDSPISYAQYESAFGSGASLGPQPSAPASPASGSGIVPVSVSTPLRIVGGTGGARPVGINGLIQGGLGMIINLQNLFKGAVAGSGFGEQEFSALSGLGQIVDDADNSAGYIDEGPYIEAAAFNGSNDGTVSDFLLAAEGQGT